MNIACIYHSVDLDGWMSAAIVRHWFDDRPFLDDTGEPNGIEFIGYNYGEPIPDLSKFDRVIMCDISFPKDEMINMALQNRLVWIDHHISAIKDMLDRNVYIEGIRKPDYAACELTWAHFFPTLQMPEIVRRLGRYDCFGHKGTTEERMILEFQYGARQHISNYEEAYRALMVTLPMGAVEREFLNGILTEGKAIYKYLCVDSAQSYKNGFKIKLPVPGKEWDVTFICINKERFNPINFGIKYHEEGYDGVACFHRNSSGKWAFSLYNDDGDLDVSNIAKQYGGGGHRGAAGMVVDDETFLNIINSCKP